jgi:hypothetical protein
MIAARNALFLGPRLLCDLPIFCSVFAFKYDAFAGVIYVAIHSTTYFTPN